MSQLNGLPLVIELATARRDALAQRLAQARHGWTGAQAQLDQLEKYAQETTARWGAHAARCMPEIMRHHYQFMDRLHHAMRLQSGIVAEQADAVSREAQLLREAECRLESMRMLQAVRHREGQRAQDRREQKLSDEQAAMQHRRHAADRFSGGA